jgi:hypothetical protein
MKLSSTILTALAASAFAFSPVALHAQDNQGGPPPLPMDQGAPPPPDQQGGPPPDGQGAPPPDQGGDQGASFDEFYNNLSSDGQWIQTPDYGYAFQPAVQDPNWAPYTDGHWVYTTYGWTWASDEPWGWATYHYGRWVNIDGTGWVWIPGHQWAPAWVSWRYGGGYCGWAPLPPSTFIGVDFGGPGVNLNFGFHFGSDCDTAYGIGPGYYNFIPIGFIGDPHYRGHYIDRGRNFVIINNTRNITNININRGGRGTFGGVNVGGPNFAEVNRQSHTPVQQVRLAQAGRAGRSTLSNGTLNVFAPRINAATANQGRPATVARSLSNVQINRGTSISQPLQVNSRLRGTAPSASTIAAAREAETRAPKNVATSTRVAATVSAAAVQQERTQSVQRQASELHNAATTPNHTTGGGGSEQRQFTGTPNTGNAATAQVQHGQELRQQQSQQQEHNAATQQQQQLQREETLRQQQSQQLQHQAAAQQQQHEENLRQQQVQQQHEATQVQQQHEPVFHQQQQPQVQEQHNSSQQHESSPFTQQHSSAQPEEHHQSVAPQPQHSSVEPQHTSQGGGSGGGGNHSGGNSGGGGGGNHSGGGSGGGGNGGGNHGSSPNNSTGQGH